MLKRRPFLIFASLIPSLFTIGTMMGSALAQSPISLAQDEARLLDGCNVNGDTDLTCQCVLDSLRQNFTPSEYGLVMAMIISGMARDEARTQTLVTLFGNDMQAFGAFAHNARTVLDQSFIQCRAATR